MVKVFLAVKDREFSKKLKGLFGDVEIIGESMSLEEIKEDLEGTDLLFLDSIPPRGFTNLKAKVIIIASRYSKRNELLAARAGAKGFIAKGIPKAHLLKAIKAIYSGEIWMTRVTVAIVFSLMNM